MSIAVPRKMSLRWTLFLAAALVAAAIFFGIYELRYMWYVNREDFTFLRTIFGVSLLAIVLLWAFYPSRILVGLCAFACFALPPLLRGGTFVQLDVPFLGYVALGLAFLVGATELRRRMRMGS